MFLDFKDNVCTFFENIIIIFDNDYAQLHDK